VSEIRRKALLPDAPIAAGTSAVAAVAAPRKQRCGSNRDCSCVVPYRTQGRRRTHVHAYVMVYMVVALDPHAITTNCEFLQLSVNTCVHVMLLVVRMQTRTAFLHVSVPTIALQLSPLLLTACCVRYCFAARCQSHPIHTFVVLEKNDNVLWQ
jgi:hypothetical protein